MARRVPSRVPWLEQKTTDQITSFKSILTKQLKKNEEDGDGYGYGVVGYGEGEEEEERDIPTISPLEEEAVVAAAVAD